MYVLFENESSVLEKNKGIQKQNKKEKLSSLSRTDDKECRKVTKTYEKTKLWLWQKFIVVPKMKDSVSRMEDDELP